MKKDDEKRVRFLEKIEAVFKPFLRRF